MESKNTIPICENDCASSDSSPTFYGCLLSCPLQVCRTCLPFFPREPTPPVSPSFRASYPDSSPTFYGCLLSCPLQVCRTCLPFFPREPTPPVSPSFRASYPDYDVFISHRGPDTKVIFATGLYRSLVACGFQVFLDEPAMQVGHDVPYQIKQAIETASIQIVIFSPGYAQSIWCLNELEQMSKKCKSCQDIIIPVFYDVEPSVVRWTGKGKTGEYAKALSDHEEKRRANSQTIKNWRDALSNVALISGLELKKCNGVQNMDTNELSKKDLNGNIGKMHLKITLGQKVIDIENFPFPG